MGPADAVGRQRLGSTQETNPERDSSSHGTSESERSRRRLTTVKRCWSPEWPQLNAAEARKRDL